jgi:hypothetical protein
MALALMVIVALAVAAVVVTTALPRRKADAAVSSPSIKALAR